MGAGASAAGADIQAASIDDIKTTFAGLPADKQALLMAIVGVEADPLWFQKQREYTDDDFLRDFAKAVPALEAAMEALERLDKKSISQIRGFQTPPEFVRKTMCAVMTVMDKPATFNQATIELNDTQSFFAFFRNFDKDNIEEKTLREMEKFTKDPDCTPEVMCGYPLCVALCQWVHAIKIYAEVYREIAAAKETEARRKAAEAAHAAEAAPAAPAAEAPAESQTVG